MEGLEGLEGLVSLFTTGGSSIYAWLLGLFTVVASVVAVWRKIVTGRDNKHKLDRAEADLDAHERMNDADTGADLSDAERRKRLQSIADRLDGK